MTLYKRIIVLLISCSLGLALYSCSDSSTGPDTDPVEFNHQVAPGDSAEAFLQGDQYTTLQVEIDYVEGYEPTQEALNSLRTFLQERLNKQNIILSDPTSINPDNNSGSYSSSEVRSIEELYRDNFTEAGSSTLHAYFVYLDGEYEQNSNVLGIAYYNTSVAFFGQTIQDVSSGVGAPSKQKIEGTVFRHEFGHNMGLVGNGTPTQSDHKTANSAHCTADECLMKPAVETGNFFTNTFGGEIPPLDPQCITDLQANGGK